MALPALIAASNNANSSILLERQPGQAIAAGAVKAFHVNGAGRVNSDDAAVVSVHFDDHSNLRLHFVLLFCIGYGLDHHERMIH